MIYTNPNNIEPFYVLYCFDERYLTGEYTQKVDLYAMAFPNKKIGTEWIKRIDCSYELDVPKRHAWMYGINHKESLWMEYVLNIEDLIEHMLILVSSNNSMKVCKRRDIDSTIEKMKSKNA